MREIMLDGRKMTGKKHAFEYLKKELGLPEYTGNNLDALDDSLSEISGVHVRMFHPDALLFSLGAYGVKILMVLNYHSRSRADFRFSLVNQFPVLRD